MLVRGLPSYGPTDPETFAAKVLQELEAVDVISVLQLCHTASLQRPWQKL